MKGTNLTLRLLLVYMAYIPLLAQDEAPPLDSSSQLVLQQIIRETKGGNEKAIAKLFDQHKMTIRYDINLFDRAINQMLRADQIKLAAEALRRNPFLMSQHNEQALYFYYRGVTQMLSARGWPGYKQAEHTLNTAATFLKRSYAPDYGFFSDIENARGYLSITARGLSTNRDVKDPVCIVRHEFINMAIGHFREALMFNPENEYAQRNLDTLYQKLEQAGLPIPPHPYRQNLIAGKSISFDSLNIDSLNSTSLLPVLDYSLLPKNYQLILAELSQYDEIILCIDLSGSMDDPVGWGPETSKFHVAQQLALYIAMNMRQNVFLGAISVGQDCDVTSMVLNHAVTEVSREALIMQIDNVRPYGHTPLNRRLQMTKNMFSSRKNRKLVFLLSDGMDTCKEIPDLCGTAATLANHGIDLSVFSFIYETLDEESRTAYSIYNCMVNPSEGKIYKITEDGGLRDEIDYVPVSNNILVLPPMDTSILWSNNEYLFQFPIDNVIPPIREIMKLD